MDESDAAATFLGGKTCRIKRMGGVAALKIHRVSDTISGILPAQNRREPTYSYLRLSTGFDTAAFTA